MISDRIKFVLDCKIKEKMGSLVHSVILSNFVSIDDEKLYFEVAADNSVHYLEIPINLEFTECKLLDSKK